MRRIILLFFCFTLLFVRCNQGNIGDTVDKLQIRKGDKKAEKYADTLSQINNAEQILAKKEVPVLCYHRIVDGYKGDYAVGKEMFYSHIKILSDSGYHTVSPDQLYDYYINNKPLPEKPILITFDDSRIEHYKEAATILEKHGFKGVFFIMTITFNKPNYMTKQQIAELYKKGHTVGLHSWDHHMVTSYNDSIDWIMQVEKPKQNLEKIIGATVDYWAYPNGVTNPKAAKKLSKYFKMSFILYSKRDSVNPLQTIRRIIVPKCSSQQLINKIEKSF